MKAAFLLLAGAVMASAQTVYFIRHGEKPDDDDDPNLSAEGVQRAQCLRTVFGASSNYTIDYIIAEKPKDGSRIRALNTVAPLAQDLGLTVDTSCGKTKSDCVADLVDDYKGSGNILICWEHNELTNIAEALGVKKAPEYPDDSFDLIWTDPLPYNSITSITSEDCPGLDN
ncbi:phosphoglycerate mutase family [Trichoderma cornu-damae]|uniref:Phosphoglycerate mutase family n=1 Tax=Trichoderma cornu-damae TaxID=654480 RepID=A0A9P8TRS9_9HYPO|nr:phosphoglycerate mutase family [Trichoderma cornu-damae]